MTSLETPRQAPMKHEAVTELGIRNNMLLDNSGKKYRISYCGQSDREEQSRISKLINMAHDLKKGLVCRQEGQIRGGDLPGYIFDSYMHR